MADSQTEDTGGIDIDAAANEIAGNLFGGNEDDFQDDASSGGLDDADDGGITDETAAPVEEAAGGENPEKLDETTPEPSPAAPTVKPPPASWAKDKHEAWNKIDPAAQEYIELREKQMLDGIEQYKEHFGFGKNMRAVFDPYTALLNAQGVDAPKAAAVLMNTHYRLSTGTPEARKAMLLDVAKHYGVDLGLPQDENTHQTPAEIKQLQEEIAALKQTHVQRAEQERAAVVATAKTQVETFAADPAHPYFDECAEDIAVFVSAGMPLAQAYEKAVYANPTTRAKEIARLQAESEAKLRKEGEEKAAKARKAASVNVNGRQTPKTPTEAVGTMQDTMRETMKEIRSRAH